VGGDGDTSCDVCQTSKEGVSDWSTCGQVVYKAAAGLARNSPPSEAKKSSSLSSLSPLLVAFLHVLFLHLALIFFR
jgi:hypothetical protein